MRYMSQIFSLMTLYIWLTIRQIIHLKEIIVKRNLEYIAEFSCHFRFNISNQIQSLSSIFQVYTEYLYFFKVVIISFVFNYCITLFTLMQLIGNNKYAIPLFACFFIY